MLLEYYIGDNMEIILNYKYEFIVLLAIIIIIGIIAYFKLRKQEKGIGVAASNDLISALGGVDNIVSCQNQVSRLNVIVKNIDVVETEKIMNLGAKGAFVSNDKVQIMLGDNAKEITDKLREFL